MLHIPVDQYVKPIRSYTSTFNLVGTYSATCYVQLINLQMCVGVVTRYILESLYVYPKFPASVVVFLSRVISVVVLGVVVVNSVI